MEKLIKLKKIYERSYNDWTLGKITINETVEYRNNYYDYCKNNKDIILLYDNYMHIDFIISSNIINEDEIDMIESKWLSCHRLIVEKCSINNLKKYIFNPIYDDDYIFSKIYKRLSYIGHEWIHDMYPYIKKKNTLLLKYIAAYGKNKKHIAKAKILI